MPFFLCYSCKQWLNNCHRLDLESEPPEQLHKLYRLCAKHFESSVISNQVRSTSLPIRSFLLPFFMV